MRPVERNGAAVRRPTGPWTPAVHALLQHLEAVGFAGAPRVLGIDAQGYELLSYVAGEVPHAPLPSWARTDPALRSVARLVRRYHDAVRSFIPPPDAQWQATSSPTVGTLVCHNDLYPGNVVFRGGRAVALIDFDFAHPAPPLWEVAMAAWHWVPLMAPADGGPARRRPQGGVCAPSVPPMSWPCPTAPRCSRW
jgi:hypothetical protein